MKKNRRCDVDVRGIEFEGRVTLRGGGGARRGAWGRRQDAPVADEISPGGGGAAHAEDARRKAVGKVSKVRKSNAMWLKSAVARAPRKL